MRSLVQWLLFLSPIALAAPDLAARDESRKYWPEGLKPENLEEISFNAAFDVFGIRKMPYDEGIKFEHSDWNLKKREQIVEVRQVSRRSNHFRAPSKRSVPSGLSTPEGILKLFRRQGFTCPVGTLACNNINRPGSCCEVNETCHLVEQTDVGDVGCCPKGSRCEGKVENCGDKTACSREHGGGCCIKGTKCSPQGCIPDGSVNARTPQGSPTQAGGVLGGSQDCQEGFYQCPPSVGGGCCRVGRACGISDCPQSGNTNIPVQTDGLCPTGYYACAAQFNGGCCRVGRDCGINTCPPRGGGGETPTDGVTPPETTQRCPLGWYGCDAAFGGGCCPSGYNCAASSCPAQNLGGAAATKAAPLPGQAPRNSLSGITALLLFVATATIVLL